jgi:hypothetical protein
MLSADGRNSAARRELITRLGGLTVTIVYAALVAWLFWHQPQTIAQITGGQVIPPTAISEVLQLVSFTPDVSESIQRSPLWNRWSNLIIVLGCLFTEWTVRKGKGLV